MNNYRILAKDASPTFYLTLISITQSLVLGYLFEYLNYDKIFGNCFCMEYLLKTIVSLQLIILIWFEYAMSTICFKWVLNYFDSLIPFFFGISQYLLLVFMNKAKNDYLWFFGIALITAVSLTAYVNQNIKAAKESDNKLIFYKLGNLHKQATYLFVALTLLLFLALGALNSFPLFNSQFVSWSLAIINIILLSYALFRSYIWRRVFNINAEKSRRSVVF